LLAAVFFGALGIAALAQEAPGEKPAPPKGPGPGPQARFGGLEGRINRLIVEAAEKNPELKALHETQQAKWRALSEKREELVAKSPELKGLQDEIAAKRKQEAELARKVISENPELAEMQKQMKELWQKMEAKRREVLAANPEVAALRKETGELEGKVFAALKDDPDLQKLRAESDAAWNELAKKASENNPELAKAIEEREAMKKSAAPPPAEKPEKKEQPKE